MTAMSDEPERCESCGAPVGRFEVELYPPGLDAESFGRFRCSEIAISEDGELAYAGPVHTLLDAVRAARELQTVVIPPAERAAILANGEHFGGTDCGRPDCRVCAHRRL